MNVLVDLRVTRHEGIWMLAWLVTGQQVVTAF